MKAIYISFMFPATAFTDTKQRETGGKHRHTQRTSSPLRHAAIYLLTPPPGYSAPSRPSANSQSISPPLHHATALPSSFVRPQCTYRPSVRLQSRSLSLTAPQVVPAEVFP
ncbi:hypothetical protein E2C01_030844 [Portunus trituberculatus]|uniref:Uncharacterized protein n=1 Tax=Portunus trituberculatus TaxID=210409 RepID=A0A5B7ERI2_PORTR|nr:hypothetical protein [Portunus trituberculatus]